jgi:tRNA-splicing ligase RtcB
MNRSLGAPSSLSATPSNDAAGASLASANGSAAQGAAGVVRPDAVESLGKITRLALEAGAPRTIFERLEEIARLPYVERVLALPDVHWKEQMEIPSSIAIATRNVVVPEFTSAAVNDGMGVVRTGLQESDFTPERLQRFFTGINRHSAANFFDTNRYSISGDELRWAVTEGARGLVSRYGMDESVLDRFEDGGRVPDRGNGVIPLREVVPLPLLATRFSRSEMGLNFGGNHFLEVQVVDEVLDAAVASRWGFERGAVVVMYHLGPGPFGATLLHHFSRRLKLPASRVPLFMLSKLLFHYVQRASRGDETRKWGLHFRFNQHTPFEAESDEGRLVREALALAINFGYGYRLATLRAILDGLRESVSPRVHGELFCDISHNGVAERRADYGIEFVARHNACRLESGQPTIVAGSYDVPSYLGIGSERVETHLDSYDHGAGHLIEHHRETDRLPTAAGVVERFRMTRGRDAKMLRHDQVPVRSAAPIERLMECFEQQGMMRPVVRLRPLGNLKN